MGVIQVKTTTLAELAQTIAPDGIGIYEARVLPASGGFHFEVVLDGLTDPRGAVPLAICESFSRDLVRRIDECVLARSSEAGVEAAHLNPRPELDWSEVLPPNLSEENYTLEVSSAGAERRLRLPDDLERFAGQPLRMKLPTETPDGRESLNVRLVVFAGREGDAWRFTEYEPQNVRTRRVLRRREKRSARHKKKTGADVEAGDAAEKELRLSAAQLADERLRVNLYLDY